MNEISVILNVYKRPYALKEQIETILNQSVSIKPENIHIWVNKDEDLEEKYVKGVDYMTLQTLENHYGVKIYRCNHNTKFFGRFLIPLLCKTKYIAMFDDDTIPQVDWFKNCLETMETHEGLLGGSGIIVPENGYQGHTKVGWNGLRVQTPTEVDLVGHAWFFKQEWAHFLWSEQPVSWDNGEDIMFSYLLQKQGIKTFVPPHPEYDKDRWSSSIKRGFELGNDEQASWRKSTHNTLRDDIVNELKERGWKTIR